MVYDRELVAERLADLRNNTSKAFTYLELSKAIEEKTGVYISDTQLHKYENTERVTKEGEIKKITDIMNVRNMIAIADFYEVSYDYLLGKSETKKREYHDSQEITGLSEEAIHKLANWAEYIHTKHIYEGKEVRSVSIEITKAPKIISQIIENDRLHQLVELIELLGGKDSEKNQTKGRLGFEEDMILNSVLGANRTRQFAEFAISNVVRDILQDISPFTSYEEIDEPFTPPHPDDLNVFFE